jgi:hypothetical protein
MVHAPQPGGRYVAEIGYYDAQRQWSALAVADPVCTPPAGPCADLGFEMGTLTPGGQLLRQELTGGPVVGTADPDRLGPFFLEAGAIGISSLVGPCALGPGSMALSSWGGGPEAWSGIGSPTGGAPPRAFRLEVNAELIVYGATEPDAELRIGDRTIRLEADGTFRLRFSLPEGTHVLGLNATSAHTGEQRGVELCFVRRTEARGEVAAAPVASGLKPPAAENL